mmetsp:Transcript_18818/g.52567  ORF Transcript_18818/g.52567 Transcript_18818/m.52567 type:complete len:302 (+) Transcript_18818:1168-2073(+)
MRFGSLLESLGSFVLQVHCRNLHCRRNVIIVHGFVITIAIVHAAVVGQRGADNLLDRLVHICISPEVFDRIVSALGQVVALIGVPASPALDNSQIEGRIQHATPRIDPASKQNVDHNGLERGSDLVFDDLDLYTDSAVLGEDFLAAGVETDRRIKLEGIATGGYLRRTVNDTDLGAQLVQKNDRALAQCQRPRNFSHGLGHQTSLESDLGIGHVPLELGPGHQCGYAVHHNHIHRRRPHEFVDNVQGHFSTIGLTHQQIIDIDSQSFGVHRIQSVLGIHKGGGSSLLLALGNRVEGQRGLS